MTVTFPTFAKYSITVSTSAAVMSPSILAVVRAPNTYMHMQYSDYVSHERNPPCRMTRLVAQALIKHCPTSRVKVLADELASVHTTRCTAKTPASSSLEVEVCQSMIIARQHSESEIELESAQQQG